MKQYEKRFQEGLRAFEEDGKRRVEGWVHKYGVPSEIITEGGETFREVILPGAFRAAVSGDTIYTFEHDHRKILARTGNGSLRLTENDEGLFFQADLPDTNLGRDLYALIERGDINSNSFRFGLSREDFITRLTEEGLLREIKTIRVLRDVSSVVWPAYPETSLKARSLQMDLEKERLQKKLKIINLR